MTVDEGVEVSIVEDELVLSPDAGYTVEVELGNTWIVVVVVPLAE